MSSSLPSNDRRVDAAAKPLCGANWPTPCEDCVGSCGIEEYIEEQDARSAARVEVSVCDVPAFREFVGRVQSFITEYAWHTRDCAAIDADGEWHLGTSPACTCGYDEELATLVQPEAT